MNPELSVWQMQMVSMCCGSGSPHVLYKPSTTKLLEKVLLILFIDFFIY